MKLVRWMLLAAGIGETSMSPAVPGVSAATTWL